MERVLIESAVRAALLALATYSLLRLLRIRNAAAQHAAWTTVVVAMLVLPAWALWGPRAYLRIAPAPAARASAPADWAQTSTPAMEAPTAATASVGVTAVPPPQPPIRRLPWSTVLWGVYGLGVVLLFGRLTVGTVRAWRLIRRATRSPGLSRRSATRLTSAGSSARLGGPTWRRSSRRGAYLTSDACTAPIAVGWIRPVVILPERWHTWSASQLDMVLSHEHEHVRRRDPLVQWLALLNRALFWFHPLAWWLERRLALLAEEACDAAVLSRGHRPTDYSEYLLGLARSVAGAGARVHVVGNAMPGTFLSRRIRRMLTAVPELPTSARRRRWSLIVCGVMAIALAALAVGPRPAQARATESASPQAASSAGTRLQEFWFDDDEWHLEVASIISAEELDRYHRLQTTAERDSFISSFWSRRDPTPGSDVNEFRAEFERRIAYAREHFANPDSAATFGYETDRGRWYLQFGPPVNIVPQRWSAEEWRYASLPGLGTNVVVQFDTTSIFGCSYRGGRYRIASPEPLKRFESAPTAPGSSRRAFALTYPGRFVYLSFPIDPDVLGIRWRLRAGSEAGGAAPDPDDTPTATYWIQSNQNPQRFVQGDINMRARSLVKESLLKHLASLRFFEPAGIACTEQLPQGTYTLWVDLRFMGGEERTETLTFAVD